MRIKLFILSFIILVLGSNRVFSAQISTEIPEQNTVQSSGRNSAQAAPESVSSVQQIHSVSLWKLGFSAAPGLSFNETKMINDSSRSARFTGLISFRALYAFSRISSMLFEFGFYSLRAKESLDSYTVTHDIIYTFISAAPALKFKKFRFYAGPYIGFPIYGKSNEGIQEYSSVKRYTAVDIGLNLGAGFILQDTGKFQFYLGLNFRYQLTGFLRFSAIDSRLLGIFMDFTLLFDI